MNCTIVRSIAPFLFRLTDADRLRGGLVIVEKLARDPSGTLIVNLDKFDRAAVGVDESFIREQPKVGVEL